MDEVKNKHPVHIEINARLYGAGKTKALMKWSFKAFIHRKSATSVDNAARHSKAVTHANLWSSGRECCSMTGTSAMEELLYVEDTVKARGATSPNVVASMASTSSLILSSSSSSDSSKGKLGTNKSSKGPYVYLYGMQQSYTEELRKKIFHPCREGLFDCLGLSSKSYRALVRLSKPLQSVS